MARDYDATIARIAGNITSGLVGPYLDREQDYQPADEDVLVAFAVRLAHKIVAETKRSDGQREESLHICLQPGFDPERHRCLGCRA